MNAPAVQLILTMDETGSLQVAGPLDQTLLCYGMLEQAKDAIRNHHAQRANKVQPPSPAEMAAALRAVKP